MTPGGTPDRKVLGEQAFRLAQSCLRRRTPSTQTGVERVAAITLRLLEAEIPVEKIEWVLLNAKVLTESGISYTLNSMREGPKLQLVEPPAPFVPSEGERERVREVIAATRDQLRGGSAARG